MTQNVKILIVEDDAADIALIRRRINDVWPDAVIESSTSLGEAYAEHMRLNFNLVLLDLNLPDAYGAKTVEELRRLNRKVPVVVITGMETDREVSQALKLGANHVVLKSQIMADDFLDILKQHAVIEE